MRGRHYVHSGKWANQWKAGSPDSAVHLESPLGSVALAGLCILTGYSKSGGETCEDFIRRAHKSRVAGDNAKAVHWATLGERRCRAEGVRQWWRLALLGAEARIDLGLYPAALKTLEPEIPAGTQDFSRLSARRFEDQGWIDFYLAKYDAAADLLRQAEEQARKVRPVSEATISHIAFGKLSVSGQIGDAEGARQAMEEIDRAGSSVDRAHVASAYGWALNSSAHFEEAAQYYESAVSESGSSANPLEVAEFHNNLAGIYYHLGDLDQSLQAALKAEPALRQGADLSGLRICLNTTGLIYLARGDYAKAEALLLRALQIADRLGEAVAQAEVLNNLTSTAIATGDWGKAESYNRRATNAENGHKLIQSEQYSSIDQARILAGRRDFQSALRTLDAVTGQRFINPNLRIDAEVEYLSIFRETGDERNARAHYRIALGLIDAFRSKMSKQENKLAWYSSQIQLHQEWVRFLIEGNHADEALQWAEWSRARLMLERLESRSTLSGRARTADVYKKLAREQDAVLISYWLMPETSYAWVVKPDGISAIALAGEQEIASLVARYQAFIQDGNDPARSSNTAAAELRRAVLDPLLPAIGNARHAILVPDGQLHSLNFETLPVNGRYWIDDVTISVAPSLNILLAGSQAPPSRKTTPTMLVVGDAEPTPEFPKLPDAGAEIATVARFFPGSDVLRGAAATPEAYLKVGDRHAYIHFAAHAAAVAERPLDSAVILSPLGSGSDGRLTARELLNRPNHAELVTISACSSAGVRSYRGEGLVGFAWVFLQSGAHGVVAGLWDANDRAAADLMTGFYQRLANGQPPAEALRQAKLVLVHSGSHFALPYYWGPFQYFQGPGHSHLATVVM